MLDPACVSLRGTTTMERMRVYFSPDYAMAATEFDTTRKARWVADRLAEEPVPGVELIAPDPLTPTAVAEVHDPAYVRAVETGDPEHLAASNDIGWDPDLFAAVAASNGGAVAAALHALATRQNAGSLSSGLHHARREHGNGFCTFNGLALAARAAQRAGATHIQLLDLDAHCGGGTFSLLGDDPAIHQVDIATSAFDRYRPTERWTLDLVTDAADYLPTITRRLAELDSEPVPDLLLYNAGMDPFEECAVGGLDGISAAILEEREQLVFGWARARAIPVAFVLAGGYAAGTEQRRRLVALHRATIAAAADATA
jgi:acetoin utilization deacetylase AcuC-like enzyme